MSLVFIYSIQYTDVETLFRISNDTIYGGSNPNRGDSAEILIGAHVDEAEIENFITIDSTPYLSKTLYDISNTLDGHYHFETLRFPSYNGATPYFAIVRDGNNIIVTYPSVVYYATTGKFYVSILASTGINPDAINGATYWQVITDFTTQDLRKNTNLTVGIFDTLFDFRGRIGVKNELYKLVSKGCGCIEDINKLLPYLKKKVLLVGAKSKADDNNTNQAETITRQLQLLIDA